MSIAPKKKKRSGVDKPASGETAHSEAIQSPSVQQKTVAQADETGSWSLTASLTWEGVADWDLHLRTPNDGHIFYGEPEGHGFTLNHDAYPYSGEDEDGNPTCADSPAPPETITGQGGYGTYRLYSDLYSDCGGSPPITFEATVTVGEMPVVINGTTYNPGETFTPEDGVEFTVLGITFEPVDDNEPITDNKNPVTGEWMPGKGKRIFPDWKEKDDNTARNRVYVKVNVGTANIQVHLKAFDVDDPSSPKISEVGCLLCVNEANVDL
ncbi:MAG: hypothetical protein M3463_16120 [Verrucomicrobiota bacterium]|nr:hypothetical protein [Verrucomicrobiota bacterium]